MTYTNGWIDPSKQTMTATSADPRALTFSAHHYRGLYKITERAYLFIIDDKTGTWIPKSMCMDMRVANDNSITVTIPDFTTRKTVSILNG